MGFLRRTITTLSGSFHHDTKPCMPRDASCPLTLPQGAQSTTPPSSLAPTANIVKEECNRDNLTKHTEATIEVIIMRSVYIPHSAEYMRATRLPRAKILTNFCVRSPETDEPNVIQDRRDSTVADSDGALPVDQEPQSPQQIELSSLKTDILWQSLILIERHTKSSKCQICRKVIMFPKEKSWRLHGCGHHFHVNCFQKLDWLVATNTSHENSTKEKCNSCEQFYIQLRNVPLRVLHAMIKRFEHALLPHRTKVSPREPGKGTGRARLKACERQIAYDVQSKNNARLWILDSNKKPSIPKSQKPCVQNKEEQNNRTMFAKGGWRRSVPPDANLKILEEAYMLNPQNPIPKTLKRTGEEEEEEKDRERKQTRQRPFFRMKASYSNDHHGIRI